MSDNCDIESLRRIHFLLAFYSILERSENTVADIGEGPGGKKTEKEEKPTGQTNSPSPSPS